MLNSNEPINYTVEGNHENVHRKSRLLCNNINARRGRLSDWRLNTTEEWDLLEPTKGVRTRALEIKIFSRDCWDFKRHEL